MANVRLCIVLVSAMALVPIFYFTAFSFTITRTLLPITRKENLFQYAHFRESNSGYTSGSSIVHDPDFLARELAERVRVLCWVMTSPDNVETRVKYVVRTWARRCNKLVIISSKANDTYGIVAINVGEGRDQLTQKTLGGFHYVYKHHLDDADWFLKADDDTYVIVENLRYLLSNEDTHKPVYFGHHFNSIGTFDYSSGGSGFVVSKEALRRFGRAGNNSTVCRQNGSAGDEAFGQCMGNLGVELKNSTDRYGRTRFHCLKPSDYVFGNFPEWLFNYDANGVKKGMESISDYVISFHYVRGEQMDLLEYLIYHAKPYGLKNVLQDLNQH
ncbi:glycoprotein-N-acetylgalactosamine 3-beta-galactosyltransferase 1-B-like [Gigantopelta aegis]|uniref:glycoprotein-N-acetylgalactosamine 3-beta-galactosyltransferase 1-B-like n=1 Tax=Gigantopelta aegis TaxID=1735272 RepID=UPI001B88E07A|nr:glycoprotein-N-acetylgalactosamine 3-beta-galactosyltransferase 1-B-like [Gigantopelta aegis]